MSVQALVVVHTLTPFYSLLRTLKHDTPKQNLQVRGPLTALHVKARHDEDLREPLVRRQGSQVSM